MAGCGAWRTERVVVRRIESASDCSCAVQVGSSDCVSSPGRRALRQRSRALLCTPISLKRIRGQSQQPRLPGGAPRWLVVPSGDTLFASLYETCYFIRWLLLAGSVFSWLTYVAFPWLVWLRRRSVDPYSCGRPSSAHRAPGLPRFESLRCLAGSSGRGSATPA